ncbi:hypothetical protein N8I77_003154 [Diaporthe amygdali]|uniref:Uncharacterized protein n=1 Tax=Phomopsis amygdali TaxID=1214568 RepID=A0AAD9SIN7_PHOAM|nr:hypothetical protein N8I77_003154 [Diaporthe amygdali]
MTPIPPEELDEKGPGHPNWDPDLECAKLRVISIKKQEQEQIAEKKRNNEYTDEPVIEPQKRALKLIPKQDLLLPSRWFDNDEDAEAFIIAACKGNNAAVDALGRTRTSNALLQFLRTVYGLRGQRKENKEDASPRLSLQELRDRHWQAVVEESSFARDFSPHLARHVTLMLLGANRPFKEHEKFLDGSTDLLTIIDKLLQWFEQNDAAELDEFDALHPEPKQLYAKRNGTSPIPFKVFHDYEHN